MRLYAAVILAFGLASPGMSDVRAADFVPDPAGPHLLLGVDIDSAVDQHMQAILVAISTKLRSRGIEHSGLGFDSENLTVRVPDLTKRSDAAIILRDAANAFEATGDGGGMLFAHLPQAYRLTVQDQIMRKMVRMVRDRLDADGIHGATILQEEETRIRVTLPESGDLERVKRLITARVEFGLRLVDRNNTSRADRPIMRAAIAGNVPAADELLWDGDPTDPSATPYLVQRRVLISGDRIEGATAGTDRRSGKPAVFFRFDAVGTAQLAAVTQANSGKAFAIVLNGKVVSAPAIRDPIMGGMGEISGKLTAEGAKEIARQMNAAALPARFTIISETVADEALDQQ